MHLKLRDQQLKTIIYIYIYINIYIYIYIAIQKPYGNHKPKTYNKYKHKQEKGSKHNTKYIHSITREQKKKEKKTYKNNPKTMNKIAISTYQYLLKK